MPTDDPRLEQALHDAAPAVGTTDVVERVTQRRIRRRRNRRAAQVGLALVVLLAVGTLTVALTRGDNSSPNIATPGAQLHARVVTGGGAVSGNAGAVVLPERVHLDADAHLLRPPLSVGTSGLSVASYDPPAEEGVSPSHIVRIDGRHVTGVVNLKARILSIAEGEGALWALTQNNGLTGGRLPDTFVKRINSNGEFFSEPLPRDTDPVGPIAAVGGAVWVPVRDGVLQISPKGFVVRHIPLADADHRVVAVLGNGAVVTDGSTLARLDPASGAVTPLLTSGDRIVDIDGRTGWWLVDRDGANVLGGPDPGAGRSIPQLPPGFHATGFSSSPDRSAVVGTVDGAPAIVLLGDNGVRATVVLEDAGEETALAWTGPHTVRAVTADALYDIDLP